MDPSIKGRPILLSETHTCINPEQTQLVIGDLSAIIKDYYRNEKEYLQSPEATMMLFI